MTSSNALVRPLVGWRVDKARLGYATLSAGSVAHIEGPPEVGGPKSLCGLMLIAVHRGGKVNAACKRCAANQTTASK